MTGSLDAPNAAPPKVGDRVRVVIEGVVQGIGVGPGGNLYLSPTPSGVVSWILPDAADPIVTSVEVLTPPAPAWWPPTPGDVARVWNSTYLRQDDNGEGPAWVNAAGAHLTDDAVLRLIRNTHPDVGFDPPALLIRSGKAQP